MNPAQFEQFLRAQLPIAWIAGVRLQHYTPQEAATYVVFDALNQNPFGSIFWAVEGMAAEFAGGILLMNKIAQSGHSIASLVIKNEGTFVKKALGKIVFTCSHGEAIEQLLTTAIQSGEAASIILESIGTDESGDEVARFAFTWSVKRRA